MKSLAVVPTLLCALLLAACGTPDTQSRPPAATLEGQVLGASAAALQVDVPGSGRGTVTDGSGRFALVAVPAGAAAVHFSGKGVDATLPIAALREREHRSIVVEVSGHEASERHERSEVELRGAIEAIDAPGLKVAGRSVSTTSDTVFQRAGAPIAFTDLHLGDSVEVEGSLQAGGSVLARKVTLEDASGASGGGEGSGGSGSGGSGADGGSEAESEDVTFEGTLKAVDGATLTVDSMIVLTTSSTRIEKGDAVVAPAALAVGDRLRVEGALASDGSVAAKEIHVLSTQEQSAALAAGPVASLSLADGTFLIGSTLVQTSSSTQFSGHRSFGSLSDLSVGDVVDVEGTARSDGSIAASKVHRLDAPEAAEAVEVELKGAIEGIGAASVTVQGKVFAVGASTRIERSGKAAALADLKVGQVAEVRGLKQADGSLLATRVSVEKD